MSVGLRYAGKYLCVPSNDPAKRVYTDHVNLDRCGEVIITEHGNGRISVLFDETQLQFCITDPPNQKFETRPKGAIGPWETFPLSADRQSFSRSGLTVEIVGTIAPPVVALSPLHVAGRDHPSRTTRP